jgi:hypothetical protein
MDRVKTCKQVANDPGAAHSERPAYSSGRGIPDFLRAIERTGASLGDDRDELDTGGSPLGFEDAQELFGVNAGPAEISEGKK